MEFQKQLRVIEYALSQRHMLTQDEAQRLEVCRAEMECPLLTAGADYLRRGEDEVGMALVKAHVFKFAMPEPGAAASCVIYCRVSTPQQTKGSGLWRQLDTCQQFARERKLTVQAVFSEVASGIDPLPIRETAQRMAEASRCLLLCEDHSRWSRKGVEDLPPSNVVMTSEAERLFEEEIRKIFSPFQLRVLAGGQAKEPEGAA